MSKIYFLINETLRKSMYITGISLSMVLFMCSNNDISDITDGIVKDIPQDIVDSTIAGVVVDGYIRDATVFLDCNKNFIRDVGENPTYTKPGGKYSFDDATEEQKKCPVVVDATDVDRVFDEDDVRADGTPLSLREAGREGFKLSAPAGKHEVISPLTHIANTVKFTDDEVAKILSYLGLDPDELVEAGIKLEDVLYQDFISLANDDKAGHLWKVLGKKARVMTRMLESEQNKDGYSCIGQECVINMKTVLGQFTNMYNSFSNEDIDNFDAEAIDERMKNMKDNHHFNEEDFDLEEYGEVSQEHLLKSAMQKQTTGTQCTSDDQGSPDFKFFFTIFANSEDPTSGTTESVTAYAPTAEMYYDAYKQYAKAAGETDPKKCDDFFDYGKRERIKSMMLLIGIANTVSTNQDTSIRYEIVREIAQGTDASEIVTLKKTILNLDCNPSSTEYCEFISPVADADIRVSFSPDSYGLSVTGDFTADFMPYMDSLEEELMKLPHLGGEGSHEEDGYGEGSHEEGGYGEGSHEEGSYGEGGHEEGEHM